MANKKVSQLTSKPSVLTTDLFPIADPSTGQLFKTTISDLGTAIGSGVSSVNTLVGAVVLDTDDIQELVSPTNKWFTDTRARAALSASSPLTYNSGTGAFGIQVATGSQNGYLSSTDWITFNAKQEALSGTGFVKISGTTISYDNSTYLTTSAAASTYLALAGGTLTGPLNGTSATFTGDLTISSTNPRIYLTDTDNNPDYFISNTDGTFTIYDVTNSSSRLTISSSQISPRLPIVSNSSIQGTAFYSDSFFSATTFVTANNYFLTGMTSGSGALYYSSGSNRVTIANYNASGIVSFEVNGGNTALTLNSNLSATFAGALSGTSATFSGVSEVLKINGGGTSTMYQTFNTTGGNYYIGISSSTGSGLLGGVSAYSMAFVTESARDIVFGTNNTARLTIASTGAATFSGNISAGSGGLAANYPLNLSSGAGTQIFVNSTRTGGGGIIFQNNGSDRFYLGTANYVGVTGFDNTTSDLCLANAQNSSIVFAINMANVSSGEKMRITSSGNVLIGATSSKADAAGKLQVTGGIHSSTGYFSTGVSQAVSALNTNYVIRAGAYSGLIVIRDNTNGGSGVWLADPNQGFIQIANNMPGVFILSYTGGNTVIQKTVGNAPINLGIAFYSNEFYS